MAQLDSDLVDYLLWASRTKGLSPSTIRVRESVLRRLSLTIGVPLRDVHMGQLLRWEAMEVAGHAPETRRAYVSHVSAFYAYLVRTKVIDDDPTVMLTRPQMPKPLPRPISEPDLRLAIESASPKLAAMIVLGAYAGLRCMEVANLTWQDVREVNGEATISVRHGKGDKDRVVPVSAYVIQTIALHGTKSRGPMFLGREGKQMKAHSVSQIINAHLARLGIASTAHKLRARYGTVVAHSTGDLTLTAELCGWSSTETAKHYVLPNRKLMVDVLRTFEDLARPEG